MKKQLYIAGGCLALALGIIGIFVPGLPTTPFLLLSSWLFYRSSKRLHDALHRSRWLGGYLRRYQSREGVGWRTKAVSLLCMWGMICLSAFIILEGWQIRTLLLVLGAIGTYVVLFVVPNPQKQR